MNITKSHKFEALDAMRGVPAIIVMMAHFLQFTGHNRLFNADAAVDLFFILSGFVLLHSYGERLRNGMTRADYLRKRLTRLYPMLLLGLALGAAACAIGSETGVAHVSMKLLFRSLIVNALFLPYLNGDAIPHQADLITGAIFPADFPLWSLCFEMLASVLFLFLYRFSTLRLALISAVSLILFAALSFTLFAGDSPGWVTANAIGGVPRVLYGFCTGMILYRCHESLTARLKIGALKKHTIFLYGFLILPLVSPFFIKGLFFYFLIMVWAPLGVLWGSAVRPGGLDLKGARFLGRLSYPLYCLHVPVYGLLTLLLAPWGIPDGAMVCLAAALSVVCSLLAIKWYDEPLRSRLKQVTNCSLPLPLPEFKNKLDKFPSLGN